MPRSNLAAQLNLSVVFVVVLDLVQAHEKKALPLEEIILVGLAFPSSDQLLSWLALHSMVGPSIRRALPHCDAKKTRMLRTN